MKKISVIYISYKSGEEILRSVASLRSAPTRHELEVIVVDNASPDNSRDLLADQPDLKLVVNEVNLGYGQALNRGVAAASGEYYLILNPDVTVREGAVDTLVEFMERTPRAGIAGAKLLNEDGSLQHSCRSFYTFWTILLRRTPLGKLFPNSRALRRHLMLDFDHASARSVDWVLGACMLVRKQAVEEVGGMDKRFFLYFEDVDWCYRMGKRNWEVWYVPEAVMDHVHKRASAGNPFSRSLLAHISSFVHYTEKWNPVSYLLKRYRDPVKGLTLLLLDFIGINVALAAATTLRLNLSGLFAHTYFDFDPYLRFGVLYDVITLGTFYLMGLYRTNRQVKASEEFVTLLKAGLLAGVMLMSTTFLTKERIISRAVILFSVPLLIFVTLVLRSALRRLHRIFLRYNFDLHRLLIVGATEEVEELGSLVRRHPELGLDIVGRISPSGDQAAGALGGLSQLEAISEDERIQEILFAPSAGALSEVASTLLWCRHRNINVRVISDIAGVVTQGASVEDWLGRPAISYRMAGLYPLQRFVKRGLDLLIGFAAAVLTLLPGLLHLLSSRRHESAGLRRVTVLGLAGRRAQLPLVLGAKGRPRSDLLNPWAYWAVFRGHFSLVGPMPRPFETESSPELRDLLHLRPGLTGYWRRAAQDPARLALRMDLLYLHNWSPGLDVQLWLGTLGEQLRGYFPEGLLTLPAQSSFSAGGEKGMS